MRAELAAIAAVLVLAACASADGQRRLDDHGGEAKDGSRSGPQQASSDATETPAQPLVDAGASATWTDLYRDLFGPSAPASCAGSGGCHGAPGESGAEASNGYVCATKEGCRAAMLSAETGLIQRKDFDAPEKSTLVAVLRRRSSSGGTVGSMPKRSSYVFSQESIARITSWIRSGAPDD